MPLEIHSKPKEPMPENKSRTNELFKFILQSFECSRIFKMNSLTKSFNGLVFLSNASKILIPLSSTYNSHLSIILKPISFLKKPF